MHFPLPPVEVLPSEAMLGDETFGECLSHEIRVLAAEINALIKGPGSCLASSMMYRYCEKAASMERILTGHLFSRCFDFKSLSFWSCKK